MPCTPSRPRPECAKKHVSTIRPPLVRATFFVPENEATRSACRGALKVNLRYCDNNFPNAPDTASWASGKLTLW